MKDLKIFDTKQKLAGYFGDILLSRLSTNNKFTIALSGGSTPKAIFDVLVSQYKDKIDWNKIHLFWGDERCVGPDDAESNYKMTYDHLISKVPIPQTNIHRIKGENEIDAEAKAYEQHLKHTLPIVNGIPQFDMVLLGMGSDGHTASIFPHQINLWDSADLCVPAWHPESGQRRISFTGKTINNAKEIFFLITGKDKAEKLNEIINKKAGYKNYPASLVDSPVFLIDKDAGALL
ncbi:6-phosphogluconolactonase [Plebeiibacterium marinum]|uniref:6-phosphogluconolactonase n=1 Tax=Plebeiibacterium marinum TaxID=2992111 RepID=A0AAE3MEY5_9BACT|nr:6-phosphogluconolactonase [Plebeiobacterium marinum]MCW3806569.1 6-phosphogluconolactonase [Plebeiobacterium marinum]